MWVECANCHQSVEVPAELVGDNFEPDQILPYICDECENQRDLNADEDDHETQHGTACACCEVPIVVDGWNGYTLALCRHCFEAGCDPNSTEPCKAGKRPNNGMHSTGAYARCN